ncbi:MAG: acetylxylan esterase [Armatimonadetes bacterium]|nr:acetylxylan esterase [Armatimonadota bacterium]
MSTFYDNADKVSEGLIKRGIDDRQRLLRNEAEDYLRAESLAIDERRPKLWKPDYSSEAAFLKSVEPNRQRWLQAVGDFGPEVDEGEPVIEPFLEDHRIEAWWITLPWRGNYRIRGVLGLPKQRAERLPLVIAQHGIGSDPEKVFGLTDASGAYASFGRRLINDGFAVFAPMHVTGGGPRGRLERLCLMLGKKLWGLEINQYARLLDYLQQRPELDPERIGMWGLSLGGAYTLMTLPLEPRIKVGVSAAWFNHRVRKMVVDDPRHSCFLSTTEEHVFIPNWLTEFSDSDLCALIAPRAFMAQVGKCDGISWWPWVVEEFEVAQEHYDKLGVGEKIVLDLHEGGHEIHYEEGLDFLRRWL